MKPGKMIFVAWLAAGWMIAIAACFIALKILNAREQQNSPGSSAAAAVVQMSSQSGGDLPIYWDAPAFSYLDQNSQLVNNQSLRGHVWVADFIFTQCTSICPTITAKMVLLQHRITNPSVRFISFSVDPQHDTPAALAKYAQEWNATEMRWHLLATANQPALAATAAGFKVTVQPTGDKDNPIMHTNLFVLVDASGQVRGMYNSGDDETMDRLAAHAQQLTLNAAQAPPPPMSIAALDGKVLFTAMGCMACHRDARLAPPLPGIFATQVHLEGGQTVLADDAYLRESIVDPSAKIVAGYRPTMPAYGSYLSKPQVQLLVDYLKTLRGNPLMPANTPSLAVDPVCGMELSVVAQTLRTKYLGKTYYFCSDECFQKFQKTPEKYALK